MGLFGQTIDPTVEVSREFDVKLGENTSRKYQRMSQTLCAVSTSVLTTQYSIDPTATSTSFHPTSQLPLSRQRAPVILFPI